MSLAMWVTIGGLVMVVALGAFIFARFKSNYKNEALIVAEVGNTTVILTDKFKVVRTDEDYYEIRFWHQKDLDTTSPSYDKWTLFAKNKNSEEILSASNDAKKADKLVKVNKSALARGCLFYKTSEGDIKPMSITKDGNLNVIAQDNRAFAAAAAKRRAERQKGKWGAAIPALIFGGTLILCALLFIFSVIYLNNSNSETMIEIASNVARTASNTTSGVPA